PPTAGEAIVMVEGDGPLWMQRVTVGKAGVTLDIPVSSDWQQHNLYVTAVVLRKGDNKKAITPKRSFGLAYLGLDRQDRKLQVTIDTPEKVLPQTTLSAALSINTTTGSVPDGPIYLTLAAVDVGVLSISNFVTPSPFDHFFGQRRYDVQSRDIYNQVIELNDAQQARLRFGGDADVTRGGKKPQSEVQIVSLFSGLVTVENGTAKVDLKLPDFNGRLRLMAVAFSADAFGALEKELTVAAPVVTQMAMPRFLATGDKATIALDINNLSGEGQTLEVALKSTGPVELLGKAAATAQTFTLKDKQATTVKFDVQATGYSGQAQFDLTVRGITLDGQTSQLNRQWKLGVRPAYPALASQTSQVLAKGEKFSLNKQSIEQMLPDTVEASLSVSSRANMNLPEQLKNLLAYPYGCLEQTSSRAFPLAFATPQKQLLFGLKAIDDTQRIAMINQGIDRISALQRTNGSFGLWSSTSREEHWLTAFVGDFLLSAKAMGIEVPAPLLDKTMKRLTHYVKRSGRLYGERYSEDKMHYSFAYKAYAAYVLSRVNQAPLGSLRTLFDRQQGDAKTGLPLVQLGLALNNMGDQKRAKQAIDLGLNKNWPKRRYYGDYGSVIRDKAMIIHLLLTNQLNNKAAVELSFSLANDIKGRQWLSTQERNALFLAGIALEDTTADNWMADILMGASAQTLNKNVAYNQRLDGHMIEYGVAVESLNETPLFASATIVGYGSEKPQASSQGLSVERYWYSKTGEPLFTEKGENTVKVGDLLLVQLQVSAEQRTPDALLVDLIPAGFELENQNLEHAIKLDTFKFDGQSFAKLTQYSKIKHQEYRDDRFVTALDLHPLHDSNVFYLIRAVTPGTYKVPSPLVEDMYNPQLRGIGHTFDTIVIADH
ncbi:MAG: hypothetical protein ACI9FJ_002259, partial [Alteromonadaceae bacterium]